MTLSSHRQFDLALIFAAESVERTMDRLLPSGDEFSYRAKAWFKGHLPAEIDERTRTVHAVNLLGRP